MTIYFAGATGGIVTPCVTSSETRALSTNVFIYMSIIIFSLFSNTVGLVNIMFYRISSYFAQAYLPARRRPLGVRSFVPLNMEIA